MPPKKGGLPAVERRRRAQQSARDRATSKAIVIRAPSRRVRSALGPVGAMVTSSAPVSKNFSMTQGMPRFETIPNGVRITHAQRRGTIRGSAAGTKFYYPLSVHNVGWLAGLAEHFQHYKVINMSFKYIGRVSTGSGGTCVMAPYYEPVLPMSVGYDSNGMLDFLRDLPGVKEFAVWASDSVGVLAKNFTRSIFRVIGLVDSAPRTYGTEGGWAWGESTNPGWLMGVCYDASGGSGRESGELWEYYTVDLIAPRSSAGGFSTYYSTSTSDTALALDSSKFMGNPIICYPTGTNELTFGTDGHVTVIVKRAGTNPVEASALWALVDQGGVDVLAARTVDTFASGAFVASSAVDDQSLNAASATTSVTVAFLRVHFGDVLTLPALTSGSITSTTIHIYRGCPSVDYKS